jgi:MFS family permease
LAGVIGSAANLGYLMIAAVGLGLSALITDLHKSLLGIGIGPETADWLVHNQGWRLLMLFGALPALLTLLIQLFVPESHRWQAEQKKGTTSNWRTADLFGVLVGAVGAVGLIALWAVDGLSLSIRIPLSIAALAVVTAGYLYPIVRFVKRAERSAADADVLAPAGLTAAEQTSGTPSALGAIIGRLLLAASLSGVALLGTWASVQKAPTYADQITNGQARVREYTQITTASGAVVGCMIAALMGDWLGRRPTYMLLCFGSIISIAGLYLLNDEFGPSYLCWAFAAGTITAAFYGWLPLYLPELFRTKVRATGQGFGYNFGRIIAAVGVLQLPVVMRQLDVGWQGACTAMSAIYLVGLAIIWLAPETKGRPLPP